MINRNFALLLSGQFVSQIGDKFHMIALALWVLKTTGSSSKMGLVLAASLIPSLILGLFSGAVIDRFNRKYIIVWTDIIRGAVIGMFALLFYTGMMSFPLILLMQVLLSINAAFFDPAVPAVIPSLVPEEKLARANSQHQFVTGFSTIAGAFLGGVFISFFGYIWVFVVNAASFLISGLMESFIRLEPLPADKRGGLGINRMLGDLKSGYTYMISSSALMVLLFMVMIIHFFVGSIEVFMPVIAAGIAGDGAKILGLFQASLGAGCIMTALVLSRVDISGKERFTLFGGVSVIGGLYMAGSLINTGQTVAATLFCGMIFFFGASIILAGVSFKTLLQKKIDNRFAGRVFALAGTVGNGAVPGAMIIYGMLLEKVDVTALLLVSGLILMVMSGLAMKLYREEKDGGSEDIVSKTATEN